MTAKTARTFRRLGTFAIALGLFTGCAPDRLTFENYERVKDGMAARDLEGILGAPDKDRGGGFAFGDVDVSGRVMIWKRGEKFVEVTLVHGKVISKVQKGL